MQALRVILAFLLPPLAVALRERVGLQFWVNLVLTLIAWLPGVVHALYIVLRSDGRRESSREPRASPQPA